MLLTTDPRETLWFLGYEDGGEVEGVLGREFGSEGEMFGFVGRGRFFRRGCFLDLGGGEGKGEGEEEGGGGGGDESSAKRVKAKANDRKRMLQREGYRRFVCEWLPAQPLSSFPTDEDGLENADGLSGLTREMVLEEALERFGKREEYEARLRGWERERRELERKQLGRKERKREAEELEVYVRCWREWVSENEDAAAAVNKEGLEGE